jgi:hypothetical protein
LALAALLIHGLFRGLQRGIGENGGKTNPGACFSSDQKAALPYLSQACQAGSNQISHPEEICTQILRLLPEPIRYPRVIFNMHGR